MNPVRNPFAPGAGTPPPELAGRDALRESLRIALERARINRPAKSAMLVGLRGVGKTVLLDRVCDDAAMAGIHTVRLEAPEGRSLLAPELRQALLRLSQTEAAKVFAIRGLRALAGFASRLKLTHNGIEVGLDFEAEPGLADKGDGPRRCGDIAACLDEKVSSLAPTRSSLITKDLVWSPTHGDTAFTVPLFAAFMQRIVPGDAWR